MNITNEQVRKIMPNAPSDMLTAFVDSFNEWSDKFGINNPLRAAAYIAQIAHESAELSHLEENLNYSASGLLKVFPRYFNAGNVNSYARKPAKIASRVYANRMGNGTEESGEGWQYRGRGCIMTTGKANYKAYAQSGFCIGNVMVHPEWLAKFPGAQKSSMFFWWKSNLNNYADNEEFKTITRKINGGYKGLDSRRKYYSKAKEVLGV